MPRHPYVATLFRFTACPDTLSPVNFLLLLTALLTSLTGIISGDRALASRVPAAAVAAQRTADIAQAVTAEQVRGQIVRLIAAIPSLLETNTLLPRAFALVPARRLTAEKRRE